MTVKVVYRWLCLECDEHGEGHGFNAAAERHVRETNHVTTTKGEPA